MAGRWSVICEGLASPLPVPAVAPEGFEVRLWEGFGGSIHELAEAMEIWGPSEAARVLLSCIGFVEEGIRGRRGTEGLLERLGLLRGAVQRCSPWPCTSSSRSLALS
jgi:hypothetical protein